MKNLNENENVALKTAIKIIKCEKEVLKSNYN